MAQAFAWKASANAPVLFFGPGRTGRKLNTRGFTISVTRMPNGLNTVGEAVQFDATSVFGFSVSDDSGWEEYDSDFHEIDWKWTITPPGGEPSTFTNPTRLNTNHNDRLNFFGQNQFFIPRTAGTYTVSCTATDEAGNTATEETTFDVDSWDTAVSSTNTWVVYDGSDLTGAPSHNAAKRFTTYKQLRDELIAHLPNSGVPIRVACLGGHSITRPSTETGSLFVPNGVMIMHSYGTGNFKWINDSTAGDLVVESGSSGRRGGIFYGIQFEQGPTKYDATTETPTGIFGDDCFRIETESKLDKAYCFTDCSWEGFAYQCYFGANGGDGLNPASTRAFFEDCNFYGSSDYDIYTATRAPFGVRGNNFTGGGGLVGAGGKRYDRNSHGNIRMADPHDPCISDANTFHSAFGWTWIASTSDTYGWPGAQQVFRWNQGGAQGGRLVFTRNVSDGHLLLYPVGAPPYPGNILIEANTCMTISNSFDSHIAIGNSGATVRNNLLIRPDISFVGGDADMVSPIKFTRGDLLVNDDPVRAYNNTVIDLLTGTRTFPSIVQNTTGGNNGAFSNVTDANNTAYAPNYTSPHNPDGATWSTVTGHTVLNAGTIMFWGVDTVGVGTLNNGASTSEFPYWNDLNGTTLTEAMFTGRTYTGDYLKENTTNGRPGDFYDITATFSATGVTVQNDSGGTLTGTYILCLDMRDNPMSVLSGSAPASTSMQFYKPTANITPSGLTATRDFYGDLRAGSTSKGILEA